MIYEDIWRWAWEDIVESIILPILVPINNLRSQSNNLRHKGLVPPNIVKDGFEWRLKPPLNWHIRISRIRGNLVTMVVWLVVSNMVYFPFHIWDIILPIVELIFFKMVIAPPTRLSLTINHILTSINLVFGCNTLCFTSIHPVPRHGLRLCTQALPSVWKLREPGPRHGDFHCFNGPVEIVRFPMKNSDVP